MLLIENERATRVTHVKILKSVEDSVLFWLKIITSDNQAATFDLDTLRKRRL